MIYVIFILIVLITLGGLIFYYYQTNIPNNFIKVESNILYFEERIRWKTEINETGNSTLATYYIPIISYDYLNTTYIYNPKIFPSVSKPNFNISVEIFVNPNQPKNAKHKLYKRLA